MSSTSAFGQRFCLGPFVARVRFLLGSLFTNLTLAMVALAATASAASAETLLMPKRDARTTAPVVVWGVHTQAAGTACSLNFGDASPVFNCTGIDRSYIAQAHTYASQGTYTATLTVGAESATTTIQVFNPTTMIGGAAGDNNRSLGINMAIQDGLRFLWTSQTSRAASFPASTTTSWNNSGFPYADTSLVVVAFENQGYKITANVAPTGLFEKYVVRRGLNYVLSQLSTQVLGVTPGGNNPCVGLPPLPGPVPDCGGLRTPADTGYTTALAILGFAGSGALTHVNTEVAGVTAGKTYGEILQRLVNALAWGQNDAVGNGRGGWDYNFNGGNGDGSTLGWDILALLDASASGMTVPAWVISEVGVLMSVPGGGILNSDGSWDYTANGALSNSNVGPQKNGIGLQGLFLIGETTGARVAAVKNNVSSWWTGAGGIGGDVWGCAGMGAGATLNKGCAYTMFNNYKGLKLLGIATLPGVTRAAGPGAQPAGDWYADYQDWLVANQTSPTTTGGGNWGTMGFSCCSSGSSLTAAVAELILSPVALVAPDPTLFASVGLTPVSATNPLFSSHTVTASAQAASGAPVPGATISFQVLTGPNAGSTGSGTSGADGKVSFTYADTGGWGTDTIQAWVGAIGSTTPSNVVSKKWHTLCDVTHDGRVTSADLLAIRNKNLQPVGVGDNWQYDANGDGAINVADVRYCQLRLTP